MATDIATLSQLLQASLDPRQNKQGKSLFVYRSATCGVALNAARDELRMYGK